MIYNPGVPLHSDDLLLSSSFDSEVYRRVTVGNFASISPNGIGSSLHVYIDLRTLWDNDNLEISVGLTPDEAEELATMLDYYAHIARKGVEKDEVAED